MKSRGYIFWVRPVESDTLPRDWWERGAFAPLAILEASARGVKVIQPTLRGQMARLLVSLGVGLPLAIVFIVPSLVLLRQGTLPGGFGTWLAVTFGLLMPLEAFVGIRARKLVGWGSEETGVTLRVIALSLGILRQRLQVEGEGIIVWVSTVSLSSTLFRALQLARQMPANSAIEW